MENKSLLQFSTQGDYLLIRKVSIKIKCLLIEEERSLGTKGKSAKTSGTQL